MLLSSRYTPESNSLLSSLIKSINSNDTNWDSLQEIFNESNTDQLVQSFGYLGMWLLTNNDPETFKTRKFQCAYHYLHLIIAKVPPVILLCGLQDTNWSFKAIRTVYSTILRSFFERIWTICAFAKSYNIAISKNSKAFGISRTPKQFDPKLDQKFPDMISNFSNNFDYKSLYIHQFQIMILNNEPLDSFSNFFRMKGTNFFLTNAIQELLEYYNTKRNFTHQQLLHSFTMLFRYITEFASKNDIDGLIIAKYIINFPFYSPFFIIAMVTNIPTNLYLYELLVPSAILKGDLSVEEAKQAILNQYKICDLSLDHELDRLIEKVPEYLFSYFLDCPDETLPQTNQPSDYIDMLLTIHLSSKTMREIFEYIVMNVNSLLTPIAILAIGYQLSKSVMTFVPFSCFQNSFEQFANPIFWNFFSSLLSSTFPLVEQISPRFFDFFRRERNDYVVVIFLKATLMHCLHVFISLPFEKNFFPFLFQCLKRGEDLQMMARLIIMKILRCSTVQFTLKIVDLLKDCNDMVVILDFIDLLQNLTEVHQFDDLKNVKELIAFLSQKLPYQFNETLLEQCTSNTRINLNDPSQHVNQKIRSLLFSQNLTNFESRNISQLLNKETYPHLHLILRVLISSTVMNNPEIANIITQKVMLMLSTTADNLISKVPFFQVTTSHLILPIAQILLKQLLILKYNDLACMLLNALENPLLNDQTPLRWIARFLRKNYDYLTADVKNKFDKLTMMLPYSSELYLSPSKGYSIRDALKAVTENPIRKIAPDTITQEINSYQKRIFYLASISILVRHDPIQDIINGLVEPLYEPFFAKHQENLYYQIPLFLNHLPSCISYRIIRSIIHHQLYSLPLNILNGYLTISPIDVFQKVCESCHELIGSDGIRLRKFLVIVMPNFTRLRQNQEIATSLACGLFESVNSETERQLQETVIDTVGILYIMLKLHKKRTQLINAAQHFIPELKTIIASSFDIEFDPPRSPIQP